MAKPTCIYFGPNPNWDGAYGVHRLSQAAHTIVHTYFHMLDAEYRPDAVKADVVINFLSDKILKGPILDNETINFHPAPPKYPGRGGASYALFNGDVSYGATAHKMVDRVDAGPIYDVQMFSIKSTDTCETLFAKAEDLSLELLLRFCRRYTNYGMPEVNDFWQWSGPAKTKKDFQKFLDATNRTYYFADFNRIVKATKHSKFPGPYVFIHGYKFELSKDQNAV